MAGVETTPAAAPAGFVKLPRALLLEPWAHSPSCLALFIHLLAGANLEPKDWQGIRIDRGQLVTSRSKLVEATGLSEKCVRRALHAIEQAGRAKQRAYFGAKPFRPTGAKQGAKSFTLITICNFGDYSGGAAGQGQAEGQPKTEPGAKQRANRRATTKEDIEKYIISLGLDRGFVEAFAEWLDYRQEIGRPYKSERSICAAVAELRRLSGGSSDAARRITQQSIANGWQGLFAIKDGSAATRTPSTKTAAARLQINKNDAFKTTFSK